MLLRALPLIVLLCVPALHAQDADGVEAAARRTAELRLRPGDQITLNFLRDKELSGVVTVNDRGEAIFPKVGSLAVADLRMGQLQDTLRARYSEYLRTPEVEITVLRRVAVLGEVRAPNVYLVDPATSLRDLIARAGGVSDHGHRGKVYVIRGGERIPVPGWDSDSGMFFTLHSGDQVTVGKKNWLQINALSAISTGILIASFVLTVSKS